MELPRLCGALHSRVNSNTATGQFYFFLTNNFSLAPKTIAYIYCCEPPVLCH